ncbi:LysR family transcriptional regulator [Starkeya sp. ORNL1]|uniref:LysR substrate-binding domain-containing protein n=1 Tax=Starkeya sp. ORNL1 TaxID=2709380 RepID=UPI0014637733|nr:LysR substrate-binding domain-containing protein [Starkeya sp. ORNL1]QJP14309.1 LysR family transcriptional regulator [Starkeya sp. ORNL1]
MSVLLDIDQLRTFMAIAETGSFTKASDVVHKTQSAVSMQMKRLEERVGRAIFARDGRASKLTDEGERLLDYARRIVKLNMEAMASLSNAALTGRVRLGVPDDYADRYLPEIMARFSRTHSNVELTVVCDPSNDLADRIDTGDLDLAIVTDCDSMSRETEIIRREQLLWVGSARHSAHLEDPLPLALGRQTCNWRHEAIAALQAVGRPFRILYTSSNSAAVSAAVMSGLAISVLAESGLRPGMRVLGPSDGFPALSPCRIGILRNKHEPSTLADALANHIIQGLDNISEAAIAAE